MSGTDWLLMPLSDLRIEVSVGFTTGCAAITKRVCSLLSAPRQCLSLLVAPNDHGCLSVTLTVCLISPLFSRLDNTTLPPWLSALSHIFGERRGRELCPRELYHTLSGILAWYLISQISLWAFHLIHNSPVGESAKNSCLHVPMAREWETQRG